MEKSRRVGKSRPVCVSLKTGRESTTRCEHSNFNDLLTLILLRIERHKPFSVPFLSVGGFIGVWTSPGESVCRIFKTNHFRIQTAQHAWILKRHRAIRDMSVMRHGTSNEDNLSRFSLKITRHLLYFLFNFYS